MEAKEQLETLAADTRKYIDGLKEAASRETAEVRTLLEKRIAELEEAVVREHSKGFLGNPSVSASLDEQIKSSEVLQQFLKTGHGRSELELKTSITSAALGSGTSGVLMPERIGGIVPGAAYPLRVRGLLPSYATTNNAVDFVRELVFTNAVSPQIEASAKAEGGLTFETDTAVVRTLAAFVKVSRQAFMDMPDLPSYLSDRLRYGMALVEEQELLSGDGTGVHLEGLTTQATSYDTGLNVANDTGLDKLRHAILQAELAGYPADGIVVHPTNWHTLELIREQYGSSYYGQYVVGNPAGAPLGKSIWGIPVIATTNMATGHFLVGSFRMGAAIYDRMGAVIDISYEDSDNFQKNMVTVRVEERLTLAVTRPKSFIYGAF